MQIPPRWNWWRCWPMTNADWGARPWPRHCSRPNIGYVPALSPRRCCALPGEWWLRSGLGYCQGTRTRQRLDSPLVCPTGRWFAGLDCLSCTRVPGGGLSAQCKKDDPLFMVSTSKRPVPRKSSDPCRAQRCRTSRHSPVCARASWCRCYRNGNR